MGRIEHEKEPKERKEEEGSEERPADIFDDFAQLRSLSTSTYTWQARPNKTTLHKCIGKTNNKRARSILYCVLYTHMYLQ